MATNEKRVTQQGVIEHVRLGSMAIPPHAQREKFDPRRVDELLAKFDPDLLGLPEVSERRGVYYILDGVHRTEATKQWLGDGWQDQRIQCRVYHGLTEREEAQKFIELNNRKAVSIFDKFRTGVNAGFEVEVMVKKTVEDEGLCISRDKIPGAISAVGTLRRVYSRSNKQTLAKTLRIIRDGFGDAGFESSVIDGIAHLVQRYNGLIDEKSAAIQLGKAHGGVKGLLNRAAAVHGKVGGTKAHCVAAAAVDIINAKKGGKKLPSWWKTEG